MVGPLAIVLVVKAGTPHQVETVRIHHLEPKTRTMEAASTALRALAKRGATGTKFLRTITSIMLVDRTVQTATSMAATGRTMRMATDRAMVAVEMMMGLRGAKMLEMETMVLKTTLTP
jgi:hypothetical protein